MHKIIVFLFLFFLSLYVLMIFIKDIGQEGVIIQDMDLYT